MEHPYRAEVARVEPRTLVAERDRPPRGVRVRAWSDRTTCMSLRARARYFPRIVFGLLTLLFALCCYAASDEPRLAIFGLGVTFACGVVTARTFRGEVLSISPAAVSRARTFGRAQARALADVSTVVVSGSGDELRLDLQCGRERLQLADGLGYDEATVRWIAQRLRRAIEAAR